MQRDIEIEVDASTWPGGTVPADLTGAAGMGTWNCCVDAALLSLAIHTRPPVVHGFDLADMWAWMRYAPAVAATQDLRLRQEWTGIDAHQKSVLSDDCGVGFTTWFLIEQLHFRGFVETSHFVRCVAAPGAYYLLNSNKSGPNKTPDYICFDGQWRLSVLECKGSQTNRKVLESAIAKGVPQKQNFRAGLGPTPHLSLVAGLYVPQWGGSSHALLSISDPDWGQASLLDGVDSDILVAGATQLTLAKLFALMGLPSWAMALSRQRTEDIEAALGDKGELVALESPEQESGWVTRRIVYPLAPERMAVEDHDVAALEFTIGCPVTLFDALRNDDLLRRLVAMGYGMRDRPWKWRTDEAKTELFSPLGFRLGLSYVLRNHRRDVKREGGH